MLITLPDCAVFLQCCVAKKVRENVVVVEGRRQEAEEEWEEEAAQEEEQVGFGVSLHVPGTAPGVVFSATDASRCGYILFLTPRSTLQRWAVLAFGSDDHPAGWLDSSRSKHLLFVRSCYSPLYDQFKQFYDEQRKLGSVPRMILLGTPGAYGCLNL